MENVKLSNETRVVGKPIDWDETLDGPCVSVSLFDHVDTVSGMRMMRSVWKPDAVELEALQNGAVLVLDICDIWGNGRHPVFSLGVGVFTG